jgi:molybdenum cofactor cytidylyltransferase
VNSPILPSDTGASPYRNIGIIILAAGTSTRMGRPKQLLPFQGITFIRFVIRTALETCCGPVLVVLGANADDVRQDVEKEHTEWVVNSEWSTGMRTSIQTGMKRILNTSPILEAVVMLTCDQPYLNATHLLRLMETHRRTREYVVASRYSGTLGIPALFDRFVFPELLHLTGNGGKQVIEKYAAGSAGVPFPQGEIDIDTPLDYANLFFTT